MIGVELGVPLREPVGQRLIFGSRALAPRWGSRRAGGRLDAERDDASLRHSTLGTRATLDERDDRAVHLLRRSQIALVHTKIATAIAHHHVAIARQAASRNALEAESTETRQEFVGVARRSVELERELRRVMLAKTEDRPQRTKHFTGPATKFR
jgi:cobalamin biosynthesis protein CbiD